MKGPNKNKEPEQGNFFSIIGALCNWYYLSRSKIKNSDENMVFVQGKVCQGK